MKEILDKWGDSGYVALQLGTRFWLRGSMFRPDLVFQEVVYSLVPEFARERPVIASSVLAFFGMDMPEVKTDSFDKMVVLESLHRLYDVLNRMPFFQEEEVPEEDIQDVWRQVIRFDEKEQRGTR